MLTFIRSALKSSLLLSTKLRGSSSSEMSGRGTSCPAVSLLPSAAALPLSGVAVLPLAAALLLCLSPKGC